MTDFNFSVLSAPALFVGIISLVCGLFDRINRAVSGQ